MAAWNPAELETIAATREVEVSSLGEDGAHHLDEEIDAAYKEKFGYPSDPVDSITTDAAQATTIRVVPR
jgi:hypothetical protein